MFKGPRAGQKLEGRKNRLGEKKKKGIKEIFLNSLFSSNNDDISSNGGASSGGASSGGASSGGASSGGASSGVASSGVASSGVASSGVASSGGDSEKNVGQKIRFDAGVEEEGRAVFDSLFSGTINSMDVKAIKAGSVASTVYLQDDDANEEPLLVELKSGGNTGPLVVVPTLSVIWNNPALLKRADIRTLRVPSIVTRYILRGADLMLPGTMRPISLQPPHQEISFTEAGLKKGQVWFVRAYGNPLPLAVGISMMDGHEADTAERGKILRIVHCYGDMLMTRQQAPPPGFMSSQVYAPAKTPLTDETQLPEDWVRKLELLHGPEVGKVVTNPNATEEDEEYPEIGREKAGGGAGDTQPGDTQLQPGGGGGGGDTQPGGAAVQQDIESHPQVSLQSQSEPSVCSGDPSAVTVEPLTSEEPCLSSKETDTKDFTEQEEEKLSLEESPINATPDHPHDDGGDDDDDDDNNNNIVLDQQNISEQSLEVALLLFMKNRSPSDKLPVSGAAIYGQVLKVLEKNSHQISSYLKFPVENVQKSEVKLTKMKNLSKWLRAYAKMNLMTLKEVGGETQVVKLNVKHPKVVQLDPILGQGSATSATSATSGASGASGGNESANTSGVSPTSSTKKSSSSSAVAGGGASGSGPGAGGPGTGGPGAGVPGAGGPGAGGTGAGGPGASTTTIRILSMHRPCVDYLAIFQAIDNSASSSTIYQKQEVLNILNKIIYSETWIDKILANKLLMQALLSKSERKAYKETPETKKQEIVQRLQTEGINAQIDKFLSIGCTTVVVILPKGVLPDQESINEQARLGGMLEVKKMPCISIRLQKGRGHVKTMITGLENFVNILTPKGLAEILKKKCAASASVFTVEESSVVGKKPLGVMVQGDVVEMVSQILKHDFGFTKDLIN